MTLLHRRSFLLALPLVAFAARAGATVMVALDLDGLVRASSLVVVGTVTAHSSRETAGRVFTDHEVTVEQTMRGTAVPRVTVRSPGGIVGRVGQTIAGAPELRDGARYVLFLRRNGSATIETVGLSQGVMRVRDDARVMPAVTSGLTLLTTGDAGLGWQVPDEGVSVNELAARVRDAR